MATHLLSHGQSQRHVGRCIVRVKFTVVKPQPCDTNALFQALEEAAETVARGIRNDFDRTYATWEETIYWTRREGEDSTIPEFEQEVKREGDVIRAQVHTDHVLYFFLNDGTSVRYATMSDDFIPKTEPGLIGSGPGRGRPVYVDRNKPRPGIEARKWDRAIAHKHGPIARRIWTAAAQRGIRRSGHGFHK